MSGRWRVHGLSVEGYRHRQSGLPCQDAWGHADAGTATVLAVADGAGSRSRSDEGARLAVDLATDRFARRAARRCPPGEAVHKLLTEAFREVCEEFLHRTGEAADDFATTLTVVVLTPAWLGHLSVGDGFVVLRAGRTGDGERQFHLLPRPAAVSEYSNETVFLTSPGAEDRLSTACVLDEGVDGVLLSTDGLAQAALGGRPPVPNASFTSAVLRSLDTPGADPEGDEDDLAALLRSDRLTALNADDKTLLRAVRTDRTDRTDRPDEVDRTVGA
ncbi:protein phosphatase 2C domain-containing protein [Streptomyces tauricus]|uniref:Protein phosphatase 2C domain-containing protein n=1 Tax=Streptomyces tauricus TaxID=68274 RepID=A0ABZ1JQU0_9ACTN|nr:PP2C family serine/threonine-protein phosphatase [Streptomyces tauricus]MCW8100530.1 protein phosphatase 2C domain-containing protein [Streptomyces tauricus]